MVGARQKSPAWWNGRKRASEKLKARGFRPNSEALAGSMSTRRLTRMGLTRADNLDLWESYKQMYLGQLGEKKESESPLPEEE